MTPIHTNAAIEYIKCNSGLDSPGVAASNATQTLLARWPEPFAAHTLIKQDAPVLIQQILVDLAATYAISLGWDSTNECRPPHWAIDWVRDNVLPGVIQRLQQRFP